MQLAWMPSGKEQAPNAWPGMSFNQQMSFPRELTLRTTPEGPRRFRRPIIEIRRLYATTHELKPGPLAPGDNPLVRIRHALLDIELELELRRARQVNLNLRGEEIRYDTQAKKLQAFGRAAPFSTRVSTDSAARVPRGLATHNPVPTAVALSNSRRCMGDSPSQGSSSNKAVSGVLKV